ncbi:MAG: 4'-phosphopantetheinyl transferase family protein [Boseongicola sp.]
MRLTLPEWPAVDLWWINLSGRQLSAGLARVVVTETERNRSQLFATPLLAERFLIRRAARSIVLSAYTSIPLQEITYTDSPNGKPSLQWRGLHFNTSFCEDNAIVAVAGREIGVDVERVRSLPDLDQLAMKICSPIEQAALSTLCEADRPAGFFQLWTAKEAVIKWTGEGLSANLSEIAPDQNGRTAGGIVVAIDAPENYCAALAAADKPTPILRDFATLVSQVKSAGDGPISGNRDDGEVSTGK